MGEDGGVEAYSVSSLPRPWDGFDAYLFDIDGTLLNCTDAVHYFAFCDALESVTSRPMTLEGVTAHGNTDIGILRDAFTLAGVDEGIWRPLLPSLRERMCRFVHAHAHELCASVLPSVQQALEHLQAKGALLGVATGNLEGIGQLKLKKAGLLDFFEFGEWSDICERRSDIFSNAIRQAHKLRGAQASLCVIGDTPADVQAARENRVSIIAVSTGIYSFDLLCAAQPDYCVRSLEELFAPAKTLPV